MGLDGVKSRARVRRTSLAALVVTTTLAVAPLIGGPPASAATTKKFCSAVATFVSVPLPPTTFPAGTPLQLQLTKSQVSLRQIDSTFAHLATLAPTANARVTMRLVAARGAAYVLTIHTAAADYVPAAAHPKDVVARARLTAAIMQMVKALRPYNTSFHGATRLMRALCPKL